MALTDEQRANLSQEVIAKAMQCETPEELVELAKSEGYDLTLDEAEAYLAEMDDVELDRKQLKAVAGGSCYNDCDDFCHCNRQDYM
ncbi:MAG: Nif11 family protein [Selenomonadaceae bacterium]|nr:Nif11 family protein [Selenomonadaceae bacterium]